MAMGIFANEKARSFFFWASVFENAHIENKICTVVLNKSVKEIKATRGDLNANFRILF